VHLQNKYGRTKNAQLRDFSSGGSIKFQGQKSRKMRVYVIAIVADNLGKIVVTEPCSARRIRHKPKKGLNAVWDFAGDGFDVYHRLG